MHPSAESQDMVSVGVTAVVAILAVTLMVVNLVPGSAPLDIQSPSVTSGKAVDYGTTCSPITVQFDFKWLDFNADGRLDYYDYQDVLSGKVDCSERRCDLTADGLIDDQDLTAFNLLVVNVYDYDNDGSLTRDDPRFLAAVLAGDAECTRNYVCDLDGDGLVCDEDLALYTSLVYNYDNP
ncbi:hypothetical protein GOV07_00360 [Candidatus Woesearchaeota archaeon]|nr:hypothetical protein [Candidatus Woesearchaeota archaeon]